jgi:hypothetical protein
LKLYRVYDDAGVFRAICREVEAAAAVVSFYGHGSTIRLGHSQVVWTEGEDGNDGNAGECYDHVAEIVGERTTGRTS